MKAMRKTIEGVLAWPGKAGHQQRFSQSRGSDSQSALGRVFKLRGARPTRSRLKSANVLPIANQRSGRQKVAALSSARPSGEPRHHSSHRCANGVLAIAASCLLFLSPRTHADNVAVFDGVQMLSEPTGQISAALTNQSFTVMAWTLRNAGDAEMALAEVGKNFFIGFNRSNQFTFQRAGTNRFTAPLGLEQNRWRHWAVTYNRTSGLASLYSGGATQTVGVSSIPVQTSLNVLRPGDFMIPSSGNSFLGNDVYPIETASSAIDGNPNTKYLNYDYYSFGDVIPTPIGFVVTPSAGQTIVTNLTMLSANDVPERDPADVILEGSNDGTIASFSSGTWKLIATLTNIPPWTQKFPNRSRLQKQSFPFANTNAYKHYRWTVLRTQGPAQGAQIAEVELLGRAVETFGVGRGWKGNVEELRIYNRALTIDEIRAEALLVDSTGPLTQLPNTNALTQCWRFDRGDSQKFFASLTPNLTPPHLLIQRIDPTKSDFVWADLPMKPLVLPDFPDVQAPFNGELQRIVKTGGPFSGIEPVVQVTASNRVLFASLNSVPSVVDAANPSLGRIEQFGVEFTPALEAFGSATITIGATKTYDALVTSASRSFTVTIPEPVSTPTISTNIPVQSMDKNTTNQVAFVINDRRIDRLTVTVASSNANLFPPETLVLGGTGTNRTVTLIPSRGAIGSAVITLKVSNGIRETSTTFNVNVNPVSDPPTIAGLVNLVIKEGQVLPPIPFRVIDPDTPAEQITVTASSDQQTLLPTGNLSILGQGADRLLVVKPIPSVVGKATVSLTANDGRVTGVRFPFQLTITNALKAPQVLSATGVRLQRVDGIFRKGVSGLSLGTKPHTVAGWFKVDGAVTARRILLTLGGTATGAHQWIVEPGSTAGEARLVVGSPFGANNLEVPLNLRRWTHLAAVWDGATYQFYQDNALVAAGGPVLNLPDNRFSIGADAGREGSGFDGVVDEIQIWNRALDGFELEKIFGLPLSGRENGLILYWRFDDQNTLAVTDSSIKSGAKKDANDGEFFDDVSYAAGLGHAGGVDLSRGSGTASFVAPSFGVVAPTNEITIEFWANPLSASDQFVLRRSGDTPTNSLAIQLPAANGQIKWSFGNTTAGGSLAYTPTGQVINVWHHYAFVSSRSANRMSIYRDGVLEASSSSASQLANANFDLILGPYPGPVSELRVWNIARTQSSIQADKDRSLLGNETGLMAYWRFDETTATTVPNLTVSPGLKEAVLSPKPTPKFPDAQKTGSVFYSTSGRYGNGLSGNVEAGATIYGGMSFLSADEITIEYWGVIQNYGTTYRGRSLSSNPLLTAIGTGASGLDISIRLLQPPRSVDEFPNERIGFSDFYYQNTIWYNNGFDPNGNFIGFDTWNANTRFNTFLNGSIFDAALTQGGGNNAIYSIKAEIGGETVGVSLPDASDAALDEVLNRNFRLYQGGVLKGDNIRGANQYIFFTSDNSFLAQNTAFRGIWNPGTWHHYAIVASKSKKTMEVYLDGGAFARCR